MELILGDCLEKLKELEDNSVDAIVTDPPYGISFMGKKWDYDVPQVEVWRECLRVLKSGGYLLSFAGTRTQHRMAVNIEDAGFEIRDMIAWVYGSGFPKSLNIGKAVDKLQGNERGIVGKDKSGSKRNCMAGDFTGGEYDLTKGASQWEGWGTALKPALEPITVARKPIEGTVAENCLKWGVGGINIDECRVGTEDTRQKTGGAIEGSGWGTKGGAIAGSELGRFPANLIHDGSEEVVGLFPQTGNGNGGKPYNYAGKEYNNKGTSMFNGDKPQAPSNFNDSGSAARFFYCAKASKGERNKGLEGFEKGCTHPTVKPVALMRYLCRLITPKGGVILDPYMGSGTTGIGAKLEGFDFIGIEREEEYIKIAQARIEAWEVDEQLELSKLNK